MELSKWDTVENVITIRISKAEYDALEQWVHEENWNTYKIRNKTTISKLVRHMIRWCLNRKSTIHDILHE